MLKVTSPKAIPKLRRWAHTVATVLRPMAPNLSRKITKELKFAPAGVNHWRDVLFRAPRAVRSVCKHDVDWLTPSQVAAIESGLDMVRLKTATKLAVPTATTQTITPSLVIHGSSYGAWV